jgi:cytochrome c-type biogenesis protein CcmH
MTRTARRNAILLAAVLAAFALAGCSRESPPVPASSPQAQQAFPGQHAAPAGVTSGRALTVRVLLASSLAGRAGPRDTVFVFARAPEDNGPVVALVKRTAGELPLTLTLDDTAAPAANPRLSSLTRVVVGARVSRQGDFNPRPGDLEGVSAPIPTNLNQTVVIAIGRAL